MGKYRLPIARCGYILIISYRFPAKKKAKTLLSVSKSVILKDNIDVYTTHQTYASLKSILFTFIDIQ